MGQYSHRWPFVKQAVSARRARLPGIDRSREMSPQDITQALSDTAQSILRPLVRILLRNGVPYGTFADIARRVYVEVAEKKFALPGKKQTVSRISTITGLTRKEVTRIQATERPLRTAHPERHNRPARATGGWARGKPYRSRRA